MQIIMALELHNVLVVLCTQHREPTAQLLPRALATMAIMLVRVRNVIATLVPQQMAQEGGALHVPLARRTHLEDLKNARGVFKEHGNRV